jgi:3-deoxy-7-phosphoheptulonate synthase
MKFPGYVLAPLATMLKPTHNLRVREVVRLQPPRVLKAELPTTEASNETVVQGRSIIEAILDRRDPRLLVVIGPCSIHDPEAALEYAGRLNRLRRELEDRLFIVMRVYFEKPRTTIGWKGLINDPHLDGTYDIDLGLRTARQLLLEITGLGLPTATEPSARVRPRARRTARWPAACRCRSASRTPPMAACRSRLTP